MHFQEWTPLASLPPLKLRKTRIQAKTALHPPAAETRIGEAEVEVAIVKEGAGQGLGPDLEIDLEIDHIATKKRSRMPGAGRNSSRFRVVAVVVAVAVLAPLKVKEAVVVKLDAMRSSFSEQVRITLTRLYWNVKRRWLKPRTKPSIPKLLLKTLSALWYSEMLVEPLEDLLTPFLGL